ncbi:MAG: rRNA pseudouridine synthase [Lactobacillus sp.]|uniref:Pseudouridine synthase n=1 Tax=Bombilactobacillus bombi TaxID=1303590 RepID=A0A347SRC4_9LACO|nr:pseudouridine synthase [Bombilactobacillus bombi]AXX64583.1 rRNA pseudouridine synthase [Bombilactobacillus bombi]MCO6542855.1 rRNA pseudouridine synthase [Lactobacillus sp.]RHW49904.1 pseudouridine synthase [Bombilactobacillus bombi]
METEQRLQKIIANAGVTSRRKAEDLITSGRVRVNGQIVRELGSKFTKHDRVEVDGVPIEKDPKIYILFYKPRGVISSVNDEKNRKVVTDYFTEIIDARIYPVGRLDYDTSGLLLMTNDGELTNHLLHPRNKIDKIYVAKVAGIIQSHDLEKLRHGVIVNGRKTAAAKAELISVDQRKKTSIVRLTIHEGMNHQVKQMFKQIGSQVLKLKREQIGFLTLQGLTAGDWRFLKHEEIKALKKL